ncbi:hypothetical protein MRB56_09130 [Halomonas cupida]|uniref:hypothetical protein n=1 Tax=Halomonas cupida TaxID=44933 RepID=UPI0039B6C12D
MANIVNPEVTGKNRTATEVRLWQESLAARRSAADEALVAPLIEAAYRCLLKHYSPTLTVAADDEILDQIPH